MAMAIIIVGVGGGRSSRFVWVVCGGGDRGLSVTVEKALFLEFELYVLIPT